MEIKRSGSAPSGKGPVDWFTGAVRIDPLFSPPTPSQVAGALVTFEPGARTAWHTHPIGLTIRDVRLRLGAAGRFPGPRNPSRRCRVVSPG